MVAAVQPFLSGSISKTINVGHETTVEEIKDLYIKSWQLGLKAVAIYREGSKRTQPLNTSKDDKKLEKSLSNGYDTNTPRAKRNPLPDERNGITHKFKISGYKGYITVGLYDNGEPGEIFIKMAKAGSVVNGLLDSLALAISLCLQYGVPLSVLVDKYSHTRFEPSGFTQNQQIPIAKSILDYLFRWLELKFLKEEENEKICVENGAVQEIQYENSKSKQEVSMSAPACSICGTLMQRNGTCYICSSCGTTSGCS
jgi:ribonucleoside-diphosphate reductase alpha chain